MERPSSNWLSELEIDNMLSDLDPLTIHQLAESPSEDVRNAEFNREIYNPISSSNLFNFGTSSSSLNFSQGANTTTRNDDFLFSQDQVLSWGENQNVENTDRLIRENITVVKDGSSNNRAAQYAHEHVVAERKRREKLSQQFITLAMLVPGLKKTDKISLLGGAIDYLNTLEHRVKTLEEDTTKKEKSAQFSSILVLNENDDITPEVLPKIQASIERNTILLRIHCEKRKGAFVMVLSEIEKLALSVINTSVVPFVDSSLDMTITAQMEEGFCMTLADIVRTLSTAITQFK